MAKNYIQDGNTVRLTATKAVTSGDVIVTESLVAIAVTDAARSEAVVGLTTGVFTVKAKQSDDIKQGSVLYWSETEPGEIEFGSLKLSFFYAPSTDMQKRLRKLFYDKETFSYKLELSKEQGTTYGRGFIESGNGFSGEVKGKFDGSVSIKPAGRDYLLAA